MKLVQHHAETEIKARKINIYIYTLTSFFLLSALPLLSSDESEGSSFLRLTFLITFTPEEEELSSCTREEKDESIKTIKKHKKVFPFF
jgi:hypothetical protein